MHRFVRLKMNARHLLSYDASFLDEGDIRCRAPIPDGGFVGIHLDQGIVYSQSSQGGKHMFDSLYLGVALNQCGGALDGLHMIHQGIDYGFVRQIGAAELVSMARRSRVQGEGDFAAIVQGTAAQAGAFG